MRFRRGGRPVRIGGPYEFGSAWKSGGAGQQWVYVDLGSPSAIDRVVLSWFSRPAQGALQVSGDAKAWTTVQALPEQAVLVDDLALAQPVTTRYVRVLMTRSSTPAGYVLGELEVFGRGGLVAKPRPAPAPRADGRLDLAGGTLNCSAMWEP